MSKIQTFLKKIENLLVPSPSIAGLVIDDYSLRYLELSAKQVGVPKNQALLRLPPGIVEQGKIKDRANLVAALKELRKQIRTDGDIINVVLSISNIGVYMQSFEVPAFAHEDLKNAADLNLRMISPIDFDQAYSGWQRIGEGISDSGKAKFLGAFIQKAVIDELAEVLSEANFGIATVEFSSLSLVRCLRDGGYLSLSDPQVVIQTSANGVNMMITESGSLYFNYFFPWAASTGGLTGEAVVSAINLGLQQMINFYAGRGGTRIASAILITSQLGDKITQGINQNFPGLNLKSLTPAAANVLLGAAERGLVRKEQDIEIDLSGPSGYELFREHKVVQFAVTWRNIVTAVLSFMLLLFIGASVFVDRLAASTTPGASQANREIVSQSLNNLVSQAQNFNGLVAANQQAKGLIANYSPLLSKIGQLASGLSIQIQRVSFQGVGQPGVISGTAPSQAATISFKDDLAGLSQLSALDLPFSSIVPTSDGQVSFTINFNLQNLSGQ
ncbi:MAG: hypothetical protein KGL39_20965 [Patescibacteria group bacterium]|nr:hypothetical protein [Patescibacteria group bacterium]